MYKVGIMGDRDSIYGFGAAGLETFPLTDPNTATLRLRELKEEGYALIYMVESLYNQLDEALNEYDGDPDFAIIPIPGGYGNTGAGITRVKKFVERAVGADILFGDK